MEMRWCTGCCVLWVGILGLAMASPGPGLLVDESTAECQRKDETLFCDFKNAAQDTVHLETPTGNIKKVFIHNVKKLNMSEPVCVNVALYKVNNVLMTAGNDKCSKKIEFTAKTTSLDRIPGGISSLFLEECNVDNVTTNSPLHKFNIIKSNIKVVELKDSFANGVDAEITESKISDLSKLVVGSGSSLRIDKSTINVTRSQGLDISGGKVTIRDSSVIAPGGGLSLSSGDSLVLRNQLGLSMAITAEPCTCSLGWIMFGICFVLLVISVICNIFQFFHCKDALLPSKSTRAENQNNSQESSSLMRNNSTNASELSQALLMTANDVKEEYKSELVNYLKVDSDYHTKLEELKNSSSELHELHDVDKFRNDIYIRIDTFSTRYKFLASLKKKVVTIASKLASEIWKFEENDQKTSEQELEKNTECDFYIREIRYICKYYLSHLKVMCSILKAKSREEYTNELCKPEESLIKCSQELAEKINKDTKLKTALSKIVDHFEKASMDTFIKLQLQNLEEVKKNIEQNAKLLEYMAGTLPFKSKSKRTDVQQPGTHSLSEANVTGVNEVWE